MILPISSNRGQLVAFHCQNQGGCNYCNDQTDERDSEADLTWSAEYTAQQPQGQNRQVANEGAVKTDVQWEDNNREAKDSFPN